MYKGSDNPNWKNGGKSFICQVCKKDFKTKHYKPVKTCSVKCRKELIKSSKRQLPIEAIEALRLRHFKSKIETSIKSACECGSKKEVSSKSCIDCFKIKVKRFLICKKCSKEFKYQTNKKFCSKECYLKDLKGKFKKENNPNWKDGIMTENNIQRASDKYKEWRTSVFIRDNYKCQHCGVGGNLQAHHIKPFSKYKELRTEITNGLTLCKKCHNKYHRINGYN